MHLLYGTVRPAVIDMNRRRKGFTMMELIVVIFVILLFSGSAIAYYAKFTERSKLQNASRRVATMLSLVRQKTMSGDSSMCIPTPNVTPRPEVIYYSFEVNYDAASYTVRPFCSTGGPKALTYQNESNIVFVAFVTPPAATPYPIVTFHPINGGSTSKCIFLENTVLTGADQCRYVKVSLTGAITDGSCPTCAGCTSSCP